MIVVTNRIPVARGYESDFEDRFKRRVHLVDQSPGFLRNEVHRPRPVKFSKEAGGFVDGNRHGQGLQGLGGNGGGELD